MKITIYTITDCQFSKAEKEFLKSHNLPFEEKNLETNKEFLTEMLTISNNFAGTPVTKIEKDGGQTVVMKGFTKEEFEKELSLTATPSIQPAKTQTVQAQSNTDQPATPAPTTPQPPVPSPSPVQPPVVEPPKAETPPPAPPQEPAVTPTPTETPSVPPVEKPTSAQDQQLNAILNDLQSMVDKPANQPSQPEHAASAAPASAPNVPNPTF